MYIIIHVNSVPLSFGGSHFPEIFRGLHYQLPVQIDCGSGEESKQDLRYTAEELSVLYPYCKITSLNLTLVRPVCDYSSVA